MPHSSVAWIPPSPWMWRNNMGNETLPKVVILDAPFTLLGFKRTTMQPPLHRELSWESMGIIPLGLGVETYTYAWPQLLGQVHKITAIGAQYCSHHPHGQQNLRWTHTCSILLGTRSAQRFATNLSWQCLGRGLDFGFYKVSNVKLFLCGFSKHEKRTTQPQ